MEGPVTTRARFWRAACSVASEPAPSESSTDAERAWIDACFTSGMEPPAQIANPRPQRQLHRAHRGLEEELRALFRTERADEILERALETVVEGSSEDPARQLRSLVGARLLNEIADLLTRVEDVIASEPLEPVVEHTPPTPEPVRLETGIDERKSRARMQRHWTPESAVARRTVG